MAVGKDGKDREENPALAVRLHLDTQFVFNSPQTCSFILSSPARAWYRHLNPRNLGF